MEEKQARNSQEMNEEIDHLHDTDKRYGDYVLINTEKGTVIWYEDHDTAVKNQVVAGGVIYNVKTVARGVLEGALEAARRKMYAK